MLNHKMQVNSLDPLMNNDEECELCGLVVPDTRRLFRHLFDDHGLSKNRIDEYKSNRRRKIIHKKASRKEREVFECEMCQRPYLSKLGLANHKEREHNQIRIVMSSTDNIVCPIRECAQRFQTYFDLATHSDDEHRNQVASPDAFRIHRARFSDFDKFQNWRTAKETATFSKFYTRSTETKIRYGKKVWLMKCFHTQKQRSELYKSDFCPAFIRVCERFNGEVEAVACFGHLGHNLMPTSDQLRMASAKGRVGRMLGERGLDGTVMGRPGRLVINRGMVGQQKVEPLDEEEYLEEELDEHDQNKMEMRGVEGEEDQPRLDEEEVLEEVEGEEEQNHMRHSHQGQEFVYCDNGVGGERYLEEDVDEEETVTV